MSGVNGDLLSLQPDDGRDIVPNISRIARGILFLIRVCRRGRRQNGRRALLRRLCGGWTGGTAEVHDDTRLPAVEGKDLIAVLPRRGLDHDTYRRLVELCRTHAGDEFRVNADALLERRHDPGILHIYDNTCWIGQNALPIDDRTIAVNDDADVAVRTPDADARDLRHILRTVTECSLCRAGGQQSHPPDEKRSHQ